MERTITKRDGTVEPFDINKIKLAIYQSFNSIKEKCNAKMIDEIIANMDFSEVESVEDVQNQIEHALMKLNYFNVMKEFILYREQHKIDRCAVEQLKFIEQYKKDGNAATSSKYDANANVEHKNIATLVGELPKPQFIRINRRMIVDRLKKMYGKTFAQKYIEHLNNHFIYKNDETNLANYCASITMYPWLLEGTVGIGGNAKAPTNLKSFCGGFINMVFMVSSMLSGACATPEFLMYMSHFIEKEYGEDYTNHVNDIVDLSLRKRTLDKVITDCFEQIVYSINQPTGARNFQAVFWNISYYDQYYFKSIFGDFVFPDNMKGPIWENVSWLQKRFMTWFNQERTKTMLTFPVETMALLSENGDIKDKEYADWTAEMYSKGHSFFTYISDEPDSLASCCRLRNQIQNQGFSYTLGAGGVSTGSKSVLTMNINRLVQYAKKNNFDIYEFVKNMTIFCHQVQIAYNENLKDLEKAGLLPLFSAHYINIKRQYLTIGVNGIVEAAEFLGIEINDNEKYHEFVERILSIIEEQNNAFRTDELMFNCEMIPAENVGVKHAKWDKEDGYFVPRDCYNSYFYRVEDSELTILDKIRLHGRKYIKHLTGGSALHLNLEEHLSKQQYRNILRIASVEGCNYFTFNIPNTICNDCGYIDKRYLHECPKCHSKNVDYLTRIIGYMKRVSNFSLPRQREAEKRYYNKPDNSIC